MTTQPKRRHPFYISRGWIKARAQVLKRDGWRCVQCGVSVHTKGSMVVDHIIELKARPDLGLTLSNLRTLCRSCDAIRHKDKYLGAAGMKEGRGGGSVNTGFYPRPDVEALKERRQPKRQPSELELLASRLLKQSNLTKG